VKRLALSALLVAGCSARAELPALDPGLNGLSLAEVHPALWLPMTQLDLVGSELPDPSRGDTHVALHGTFTATGGQPQAIDLALPASYVDDQHLTARLDAPFFAALGAPAGRLDAQVTLLVDSPIDRTLHVSPAIDLSAEIALTLSPQLSSVAAGVEYLNDAVRLTGDGFLLGTSEGTTHALLSGCFLPASAAAGASCASAGKTVTDVDLTALPAQPWDRAHVQFPFAPEVAGIQPGSFAGTVRLENHLQGGQILRSGAQPLAVTVHKPRITSLGQTKVSLGQFVDVSGGGFVGAADDEVTLLHLTGTFQRAATDGAAAPTPAPVDLQLVPHFVAGARVRYVLDEADALGQILDLRRTTGTFTGTLTPIVRKGTDEVVGEGSAVALSIAPVKQVVYVRFLSSYVDSLRLFGLTAADADVRRRMLIVAARDYAGVNVEFRAEPPQDFALYSQVEVVGPDPNNLGLLGYDNTTGKDVGNQRLFDRIGGVNAATQSDGAPGYGGVFAEQFLGFSRHPGPEVAPIPTDSTTFDDLFDAVRPDTGSPVTASEVAAGIATLTDGSICPPDRRDRPAVLACAVFVLGNLLGSTLTHEVGHSLGLADPTGELFHDPGDQPNRLMDTGDSRPFEERAELLGSGPAVFCTDEYTYLRTILGGATSAAPSITRPPCD